MSFPAVASVLSGLLTTRAVLFVLGLAVGGMLTVWSDRYRHCMTGLLQLWTQTVRVVSGQ
jgi:hypothetical protein